MSTPTEIDSISKSLQEMRGGAESYFDAIKAICGPFSAIHWEMVPEEHRETSRQLAQRLPVIILAVIQVCKASPLTDETDVDDLRLDLKRMSAALRLRRYYHESTRVLHDEGVVLGLRPASQQEAETTVEDARAQFLGSSEEVLRILGLVVPLEKGQEAVTVPAGGRAISKHRLNTAFIMMMMDKDKPELEDVHNCFKEAFAKHKIRAIRSDDIEHQDVITTRILDEISTSEFLIADLTGERPSVYYEVGYAHATGKRPILYRKKGTPLHFDLAVHNVPEYENITDLRTKLDRRLAALLNKEATADTRAVGL
jgi:hypothetical protein